MFRALWVVAHQFVDDFTKKKMSIHGSSYSQEILKFIEAQNLQQKYGGSAPNVTKFWPPQF